jgi:Gpi18-like mannosyltransferase
VKIPSLSPLKSTTIVLIFLSLILRVISIPYSNIDVTGYLLWYQTLYQQGIGETLATNFAIYTPPYTYLLALATLAHDLIPPLTAIKLIPICFDLLGAFYIYKIVKLKYAQGDLPYLAAAIYFIAPTIVLNSAYWGQIDSLYTSLLLACLYYLMTEKPFIAMLAFGLSFSVKAQAVFFLPFLGIMAIRKRLPWLYFGMVPMVYLISILPVVVLGRPFLDALLVYTKQSSTFVVPSMNAPNIYIVFPREWYASTASIGIIATVAVIAYWVYTTSQRKTDADNKYIILAAFISVALVPFLLPKMHDRYFYPADVLSIVLAFYWPALWFVPVLYQFASTSAISIFLFNFDSSFVFWGFLLNAIALASVLRTQSLAEKRDAASQKFPSAISWLATALTPLILLGFSINFLLTPAFIRLEYAIPHTPTDQYGFSKSERFLWATRTIDYLTSNKDTKYLSRQIFENGSRAFHDHEIQIVDNIKNSAQVILAIWHSSLAVLFLLGLFAWAGDWLAKFRQGIKRGGWLTIGLAIILGVISVTLGYVDPDLYFQNTEILPRLFPIRMWQDALLFMAISTLGSGFLLAISLAKIENMPPD